MRIKEIIDQWDPMGLLACAPEDEYDAEIQEIEGICRCERPNVDSLAQSIYDVFYRSFGMDFASQDHHCTHIAELILGDTTLRQSSRFPILR